MDERSGQEPAGSAGSPPVQQATPLPPQSPPQSPGVGALREAALEDSFDLTRPGLGIGLSGGHGLPVRVGNYLLTREIATGGMGTIYEAVQDQPRRVVALKLLPRGRPSPGQQKRF